MNERIGRAWGQVAHLHAVMDSPALREAYNANLPKITQYWTELGQNEALFAKYKALHASKNFSSLTRPRQRIVENALRDFRLSGAELCAVLDQDELAAIIGLDDTANYYLLQLPNVVLTPHLGASTVEAQVSVAREAAQLLTDYLTRGVVGFAVNMAGTVPFAGICSRTCQPAPLGRRSSTFICSAAVIRAKE